MLPLFLVFVDHTLNAANTSSRSGKACLLADVTDCIVVVVVVVVVVVIVVLVVVV
jgi:hypothetical protein